MFLVFLLVLCGRRTFSKVAICTHNYLKMATENGTKRKRYVNIVLIWQATMYTSMTGFVGGKVMIYVKEGCQCKQIDTPEKSLEPLVGKTLYLEKCLVISLYRPPTAKDILFDHLSRVFKRYGSKKLTLMGDFNLNWLDKTLRVSYDNQKTSALNSINHPSKQHCRQWCVVANLTSENEKLKITSAPFLHTCVWNFRLILIIFCTINELWHLWHQWYMCSWLAQFSSIWNRKLAQVWQKHK